MTSDGTGGVARPWTKPRGVVSMPLCQDPGQSPAASWTKPAEGSMTGSKSEHEKAPVHRPHSALRAGRECLFTARRRHRAQPRRQAPRPPRPPPRPRPSPARPQPLPPSPTALAPDPAEAVIQGVEPNAEIGFWTFYLSPTFDQYIKDTIARFEATYPGVKVNWEDHQATFQDDLNNAFAAGNAPDVINLSVSEGWVSDYATKGLLLGLDRQGPAGRQGHLLPGPLEGAAGRRRELPVPVVPGPQRRADQQGASSSKAGLERRPTSRRRIDGLPALCKTHQGQDRHAVRHPPDRQRPARRRWSTRATSRSSATTARRFTFDSPEGVAWLQMYVDMVKAGTVDNDRPHDQRRPRRPAALLGRPGRRSTRPARTSSARSRPNNATLYGNLGMRPGPGRQVRRPRQGPDVASRSRSRHEVPERVHRARPVLHEPAEHGRVRQAGRRLPVDRRRPTTTRSSSTPPSAIEDSARPLAKDIVATYADIVPTIPEQGRRQRRSSSRRSSRRCSTTSPPRRPSPTRSTDGQQAHQVAARASLPIHAGPPPSRAAGRSTTRPDGPTDDDPTRSATPYLFLAPALVLLGDLRRVPDHRGRLLQLHRLRHRPAAGLRRPRELPAAARRRDVLAGARRTRSSTCS